MSKEYKESFPEVKLECSDYLTFKYSSDLCQQKLDSIKNKTDYISFIEKTLIEAFKYDNTNIQLINKIKEYSNQSDKLFEIYDLYKPINNDFIKKIFSLIDIINKYDNKNILEKYEIQTLIINDSNELKQVINQFNKEISLEKKEFYLLTIYYNWITALKRKIYEHQNNNLYNNNEYIEEEKYNQNEILTTKINELNTNIKEILKIDEDIDNKTLLVEIEKKINSEKKDEIIKQNKIGETIDINTITNEKIKKLNDLDFNLNKNIKCLDSFNDYFTEFYYYYLNNLKEFFNRIPNTLKYLQNLNYSDKNNLIILNDFIFFLSNFDFEKIGNKEYIDYYEKTFDEFKEIPMISKIKEKNLFLYMTDITIKNYENYNLNYYDFDCPKNMRFLYEKYVKFPLISENSLFNKYKKEYLKFFKQLFLNNNSYVKKLFIKTFPILKDNYFIDENLLEYIFKEKIHIFNFQNNDFSGQTDSITLNLYIKSNFNNNEDKIEVEICFFAAYIIIIIHELSHFIRIYIYKYLGLKEYEKSFEFDDTILTDIGFFIEKKLFGKIMEKINLSEALYILNIEHFFEENFLEGFINSKKYEIDDNVKEFLKNVGIDNNIIEIGKLDKNSEFKIRGFGDGLYIGRNQDK